jgi:hypothetical protein
MATRIMVTPFDIDDLLRAIDQALRMRAGAPALADAMPDSADTDA